MTDDAARTYNRYVGWFIALGLAGFAVIIWLASGRPGLGDIGKPLFAGNYSCWSGGGQGFGALGGPGIVVRDGEVVEAHYFDMTTGRDRPVPFGNVEILGTTKVRLDSIQPLGDNIPGTFVCERD